MSKFDIRFDIRNFTEHKRRVLTITILGGIKLEQEKLKIASMLDIMNMEVFGATVFISELEPLEMYQMKRRYQRHIEASDFVIVVTDSDMQIGEGTEQELQIAAANDIPVFVGTYDEIVKIIMDVKEKAKEETVRLCKRVIDFDGIQLVGFDDIDSLTSEILYKAFTSKNIESKPKEKFCTWTTTDLWRYDTSCGNHFDRYPMPYPLSFRSPSSNSFNEICPFCKGIINYKGGQNDDKK